MVPCVHACPVPAALPQPAACGATTASAASGATRATSSPHRMSIAPASRASRNASRRSRPARLTASILAGAWALQRVAAPAACGVRASSGCQTAGPGRRRHPRPAPRSPRGTWRRRSRFRCPVPLGRRGRDRRADLCCKTSTTKRSASLTTPAFRGGLRALKTPVGERRSAIPGGMVTEGSGVTRAVRDPSRTTYVTCAASDIGTSMNGSAWATLSVPARITMPCRRRPARFPAARCARSPAPGCGR